MTMTLASAGSIESAVAASAAGSGFWLTTLLGLVLLLGFVALWPMFAIWLERKVAADFQSRMGPMYCGGFHGWLQSLADGIKLAMKEDLIPRDSDRFLFWIAPAVAFFGVFAAFIALPIAEGWQIADVDLGLLFILAISSIGTLGIVMAGWSSNNKWSLYGAMREAAQLVSYEIPLSIALLSPLLVVGSLRLGDIVAFQSAADGKSLIYWSGNGWFALYSPWTLLAGVIYYISSLAECKRAPFDLPEAESELVAGFHTEYSGLRFSFFFLEEYAMMFIVSAIGVLVFLGGWQPLPWISIDFAALGFLGKLVCVGVVLFKAVFLVWVQIWLRWTLPRLRIDQVMVTGYKYLTPLSFLALVMTSLCVHCGDRVIPTLF